LFPESSATTRRWSRISYAVRRVTIYILLGLRGHDEEPHPRGLADLLDERIPVVPGLGDPRRPRWRPLARRPRRGSKRGDGLPIGLLRGRALRREARDARRDDRPTWSRHRSDREAQAGLQPLRLADDALRASATREPLHLRHQRAAHSSSSSGRACSTFLQNSRPKGKGYQSFSAAVMPGLHRQPRHYTRPLQDQHALKTASDRKSARPTRRPGTRLEKGHQPPRGGGTDRFGGLKTDYPPHPRGSSEESRFQRASNRKNRQSLLGEPSPPKQHQTKKKKQTTVTRCELVGSNSARLRSGPRERCWCRASPTSTRRCLDHRQFDSSTRRAAAVHIARDLFAPVGSVFTGMFAASLRGRDRMVRTSAGPASERQLVGRRL